MTIFEYLGYDARSFLHGSILSTIFAVVSLMTILLLMRSSGNHTRRMKQLRRRF